MVTITVVPYDWIVWTDGDVPVPAEKRSTAMSIPKTEMGY
jgi:hypothetical protein